MEAQAGLIDQLDALWLEAEVFGEVASCLLALQAVAVLLAVALMPSAGSAQWVEWPLCSRHAFGM